MTKLMVNIDTAAVAVALRRCESLTCRIRVVRGARRVYGAYRGSWCLRCAFRLMDVHIAGRRRLATVHPSDRTPSDRSRSPAPGPRPDHGLPKASRALRQQAPASQALPATSWINPPEKEATAQ